MTSYSDMVAQIEELRKQAERKRKEEYASVVKVIKKQILDFGIKPEDLGFGVLKAKPAKVSSKTKRSASRKSRTDKSRTGAKIPPKYTDGQGNTWTGRGKQPRWVVDSLAAGRTLQSMIIHSGEPI